MQANPGLGDRIGSYALVSYVPGPLGDFLDEVRRQLVPSCVAQSHVTVLPPRALRVSEGDAKHALERELFDFSPFTLTLNEVEVFGSTSVIYVSIGSGIGELRQIHDRLNRDGLAFTENHLYHPHVTLAQDFPPQEMNDMVRLAKDCWSTFAGERSFRVDFLTLAKNTDATNWRDVADIPLGDSVLAGTGR